MTKKEETVLEETVNVLKKENNEIKEILKVLSEKLIKKEEQEKLPFSLEKNIQMNINEAINESIKKTLLNNYNSPLRKLIETSIEKYKTDIMERLDRALMVTLCDQHFNSFLEEAVKNKISRELVGAVESNLGKTINTLKQDPVFRSELVLKINELVSEYNA